MPRFADCSIVMLAHNGVTFTRHCFANLLAADVLPRQMIVVDNGSTDQTPELLDDCLPDLREAGIDVITWRNAENLGCSEARNQAWAKADQPYTLFMDNDTAVCTPDWLDRLVEEMDATPQLGILGPKLIYPFRPHPIQCAGVSMNPKGRIRFRGRGADRHAPAYCQPVKVPVLISACWIMRTHFLADLGGLDPLFHPVQYEDLDYCMRVNQAGYHCAYTPRVELYHFEGRTTGAAGKQVYVRVIAENSAKFRRKWRDTIRELPEDEADYRWLPDEDLGLRDELDLSLQRNPLP